MPSYSAALTGGSSPNSHRIEFHIQLISQNVAANTSRIARGLYIVHTGGSPGSWIGSDTYPYTTNIGGVQVNGNAGYDFRSNLFGSILIAYDVRDYTHNADGTLSLSFSASYSSGHIGSGSMSGTYSPPTIPRASVSSFSAGLSFDVGTAVTINTNRASSSFTHTLQLWEHGVGAQTPIETIGTGVGASKSWTPDLALAEYFPNAVERTFFLRTITFNGATQIGVRDLVFTLRAPTGMVPTVSGILVEDQNPTVVSTVGKPVQSLSPLKVTVSGAGIHGSTVESAVATIMGTTVPSGDVVLATQAGSVSVTATVTDSRGRQGVGNTSVDVLAYAPPAVTAYQVRRCDSAGTPQDNGEHLRVDITASIQSLINSTQRNAMTIRAFTKPLTGTTWTNRNVIDSPALTWEGGRGTITTHFVMQGGAVFAGTESWDVRVEVHDKFQKHDALTTVATDAVVMDFGPDGVGVGKMHEQGALDVAGDVYAGGKLLLPAASNAEAQGSSVSNKAVTPVALHNRTATEERRGLAEIATTAETATGTDNTRIVSPLRLREELLKPVYGVIPTSVAVGSGSASVAAEGTVTFTGASTVSLNGVFDGTGGDMYDVYFQLKGTSANNVYLRLRSGGTDLAGTSYNRVAHYTKNTVGPTRSSAFGVSVLGHLTPSPNNPPNLAARMTITTPVGAGTCFAQITSTIADGDRVFWQEFGQGPGNDKDGFTIIAHAGTLTGKVKVVKIS